METVGALLLTLLVGAIVFGAYFLPALVAIGQKHKHAGAITILNLFLGWTFIGWVAALVWACIDQPREPPQWMKDRYRG